MEIVFAAKQVLAGISWSTFVGIMLIAAAIVLTLYFRAKAAA